MTRTPLRIAAAAAIALALMGADSKCSKVESDRPPAERHADPRNARTVQIRADGDGPYTVLVIASEVGKSGVDRTGPEPVAGGKYRQTLTYTSGLHIVVRMSVKGSPGDRFECSILDGQKIDRREGLGEAVCLLTTSR